MDIKYCDVCGRRADVSVKLCVLTAAGLRKKSVAKEKLDIHYECIPTLMKYLGGIGSGWCNMYVENFDKEAHRKFQDWLEAKKTHFEKEGARDTVEESLRLNEFIGS